MLVVTLDDKEPSHVGKRRAFLDGLMLILLSFLIHFHITVL